LQHEEVLEGQKHYFWASKDLIKIIFFSQIGIQIQAENHY